MTKDRLFTPREYFLCLQGPSNLTGQWEFTDTKDPDTKVRFHHVYPKECGSRPESSSWTSREPVLHSKYSFNVKQIHSLSRLKFFVLLFYFLSTNFPLKEILSVRNRVKPCLLGKRVDSRNPGQGVRPPPRVTLSKSPSHPPAHFLTV